MWQLLLFRHCEYLVHVVRLKDLHCAIVDFVRHCEEGEGKSLHQDVSNLRTINSALVQYSIVYNWLHQKMIINPHHTHFYHTTQSTIR